MTPIDARRILNKARGAQAAWAELPTAQQHATLARLRREIARQCEAIAELIAAETSKPLLDALGGDVLVALEMIRYCERNAAKVLRSRRAPRSVFFFRGAQFETHYEPHGVALIFGPSNYPFQLSVVPLITALAAGNAVVLKCSDRTPQTALAISNLCAQAGFPSDLVQVLHGDANQAAALIDAAPDIIFFTGSSPNGQKVAERAARLLIPCILELGGKDAALVFADCNLKRAVEGIAYGAFANSGRVCVGVKRAYVQAPVYEEFVDQIRQRVAKLNVGTTPDSDLLPLSGDSAALVRMQIDDAIARGATLHTPHAPSALSCEPALLTGVPADARILNEECFGPVLCVAPFDDEAHAICLANDSAFALSGSVWTGDRARGRRLARRIAAGTCAVNDIVRVIANPYTPFGGNGRSGYGRYHGPEGLRAFSRTRTVMIARDRRAREINWFPFTSRTRQQLASLLRFRHLSGGLLARLNRMLPALLLSMSMSAGVAQPNPQTHLALTVKLTEHARGELAYLVFASASGFPGDRSKAIRHGFMPIPGGAQNMKVDLDLPAGTYAVSVYEDTNGNHTLDHNFLGIPREPVGASNNPAPRLGPPRFSDCSFELGAAPKTIDINLVRGL